MWFNKQKKRRLILAQNGVYTPPYREKQKPWPWRIALAAIFCLGALMALSSEKPKETGPVNVRSITEEIPMPLVLSSVDQNEEFWQIDQVREDDTLEKLFDRMRIYDKDAISYLTFAPEAKAFTNQLKPNHTVETKTNRDGRLLHLEYELDSENILIVGLTPEGYQIASKKLLLQNHTAHATAIIRDSLFGATDDAGIPDQIALQIADIFSSEIDFVEDIRDGDTIHVVYEAFYNAGELMKVGNVLGVEVNVQNKPYNAVRFGEAEGKYAYYSFEGKSLHKSFLRSPVEFTRVSSSFSKGRFHPILHRFKAHKGVDLAAPSGTRIKAVSDGVVDFVGIKGGYGNVIVLKHPNNISTVYGHLSRFESGLKKGQSVTQGDIIGYVGMTGLATGPHLHYEFLLNNTHHDPMTVSLPIHIPIDAQLKAKFTQTSQQVQAQIGMLKRSVSARKDKIEGNS